MVRGLVSSAILGATILSFNAIALNPAGASTPSVSNWLAMDGSLRYVAADGGQFGWGNEGPAAGSTCPSGVDVAGSHGLFNCGSAGASGFEPNPATAANGDSSIIARQFLPDPANAETTTGCPAGSGDQSVFHNGQSFGVGSSFALAQGAVGDAKDDISNGYFIARTQQAADPSPGDKELFFGLERIKTTGDVAVDVEFTQQGASITGTCASGTLNQPRSQGDFGIEFDWVGGGSIASPQLFVWQCTGTNAGNPATGTACDKGATWPNAGYVSESIPAGAIKLAENTAASNSNPPPATFPGDEPCGGWVCRNTSGATTTVPQFGFVEGGIDLNLAGVGATCASTVLAATHTSQSFTSDLKDLVGPGNFSTCPSTTKTSVVQEGATTAIGNSWHDTANVSGNFGTPTGTIQFYSCSPSQLNGATSCNSTIGSALGSPVGLDGSGNATSPSITPNAVGTWCFAGYYSGSPGKYDPSSDTSSSECFTVSPATPALHTTISAPSDTSVGNAWNDSATVTGNTTGGAPTGSVSFQFCHESTVGTPCSGGSTVATLSSPTSTSGDVSTYTLPAGDAQTPGNVGGYCYNVSYAGAGNYLGVAAPDDVECFTVTPATPTLHTTITPPPGSPPPTSVGNSWNDSATLTGNTTGGAPTGSVTFTFCKVSGSPPCTGGTLVDTLSAPTSSAGDVSTYTLPAGDAQTPKNVGTYCYNVSYAGFGNYSAVAQQDDQECFTVTPANSGTKTTASTTTQAGPGSIVIGPSQVTDSVTVTGNATGGPPSGSVTFYACFSATGPTLCAATAGNQVGSAKPLSGSGDTATATSDAFGPVTQVGTYCFAAVYAPDGNSNYLGSSDNVTGTIDTDECFTVNPATPVLDTTIASPSQSTIGNTWNDSATLTGNTQGGAPTGTVTFKFCKVSGTPPCTGGSTVGTLTAPTGTSGDVSTYTLPAGDAQTPTTVGTYCYNVSYAGFGNYSAVAQQDDQECFTVTPATPGFHTTITFPNDTSLGNSWNDSATVTGVTGGGAPTGSVAFTLCKVSGTPPCTGGTPVDTLTAPTSTSGVVSTYALPDSDKVTPANAGTYCYNVSYTATDGGNYNSVSAPDDVECFTVGAATPTLHTNMTSPTDTSVGNSWNDTAVVTGNATGGAPTGSVAFALCKVSGTPPCTGGTPIATLDAPSSTSGDVSTYALPAGDAQTPTSVGTYCYNVSYAATAGGNYNSVTQQDDQECFTVTPATSTTTTQQSTSDSGSGSINLGGTITDVATVTGNSTGGAPAGTVTFTECGPTSSAAACSDGTPVGTEPVGLTAGNGDSSTAASPGFTPTAVGTYCFAAVYNPAEGGNYLTSDDNVSGDVQASECFLVTRPDFKVTKTNVPGDGNPVAPGSTVPYTVTIQNIGDGTGSAQIQDTLPSNLAIVGTPQCGDLTGSDTCSVSNPSGSTWQFDVSLAAGDSVAVTFNATVAASDTADVVNTATITDGNCDNGQTPAVRSHAAVNNCSSTVTNPVPDFTVTKTDVPGNNVGVTPGATIPYTVVVKNVGDGAGAATITDTLPSVLTIQGKPSCAVTGSDTCTVTNTTGSTWTFAVNLAVGNTATVTFSAVLAASTTGTVTNTATITTGPCNTAAGCSSTVSNPIIVTVPTTTTTTTTTTTAPPVPKPATIAFTGADIAAMVASALALLGLGGFLVMISRRRRRAGDAG